ncbi:hypothetical protein [Aquipuribacter sp. MA13-6]|uniref:hypothetical protein n=1 Tax=unclassified Aquipuribacter TaxID=2635084 RepID=UPI003EE93BDC
MDHLSGTSSRTTKDRRLRRGAFLGAGAVVAVGVAVLVPRLDVTSDDDVSAAPRDATVAGGEPEPAESTTAEKEPMAGPPQAGPTPEGFPFGEDSVWRDVLLDAPVHDNSDGIVSHLTGTVDKHFGGIATFNLDQYNVAYYVVDESTPRVDVEFDDCQDKGYTPSGLYEDAAHFADVPIPPDARPAEGNDGALVMYSPDTDQIWEFWRAEQVDDGWQACWGGRLDDVSSSPGYFDGDFGTTATGLSHAGGMVSLADVERGSIDHAVALLAAEPATYQTYSWPAQRSDGFSDDPDAVPEGLRLRLPADVDVDALDLHPVAAMVARAAQVHGFVVVDKAGATGVYTESGDAAEARTGVDPWDDYLGDTPAYEVMADFPWDQLEAMPMDYGKPDE